MSNSLRSARIAKTKQSVQIAYHEAGHATIGRVLTLVSGGASILANENSFGRSILNHYEKCEEEWVKRGKRRGVAINRQRAALDAAIVTAMAGVEAEMEFFGKPLDGSADADMALIRFWSFDEPVDRSLREVRLRSMARMLVRRHRERIERVAQALFSKGKLTAKQIDKLVGRSVDDIKPNMPD